MSTSLSEENTLAHVHLNIPDSYRALPRSHFGLSGHISPRSAACLLRADEKGQTSKNHRSVDGWLPTDLWIRPLHQLQLAVSSESGSSFLSEEAGDPASTAGGLVISQSVAWAGPVLLSIGFQADDNT